MTVTLWPKLLRRKQRALHDRVVGGATARISKAQSSERGNRNKSKTGKKYSNWKLEDGGLDGSAKGQWDHMRTLHEKVVERLNHQSQQNYQTC